MKTPVEDTLPRGRWERPVELAKILGVSQAHILNLKHRGMLPFASYPLVGSQCWQADTADVEQYLRDSVTGPYGGRK